MTKRAVDNYSPGKRIPHCELLADFEYGHSEISEHPEYFKFKLLGAREPYSELTIIMPQPSMAYHSSSSPLSSSSYSTSRAVKRSLTPQLLTEGTLDKSVCTA